MIVIDTSAIVAIFRQEADAAIHAACIADDDEPLISAATLVETSLVLRGLKRVAPEMAEAWLDDFVAAADIRVEPVTAEHAALARLAHMRFGKGTRHGASLNYGDCFAYALARAVRVPLLAKGDDFPRTDIDLVLPRR